MLRSVTGSIKMGAYRAKTTNVVATKALAHKLARASYHMLKERQPFDVKRCFA